MIQGTSRLEDIEALVLGPELSVCFLSFQHTLHHLSAEPTIRCYPRRDRGRLSLGLRSFVAVWGICRGQPVGVVRENRAQSKAPEKVSQEMPDIYLDRSSRDAKIFHEPAYISPSKAVRSKKRADYQPFVTPPSGENRIASL